MEVTGVCFLPPHTVAHEIPLKKSNWNWVVVVYIKNDSIFPRDIFHWLGKWVILADCVSKIYICVENKYIYMQTEKTTSFQE